MQQNVSKMKLFILRLQMTVEVILIDVGHVALQEHLEGLVAS